MINQPDIFKPSPARPKIEPREYQDDARAAIEEAGDGRWLVQMATGLGKTVVFALITRQGRTLILSHRDELVRQPIKYFNCPVGIEQAGEHSRGEEVVSASVQSLVRRLDRFNPSHFHTIIVDEAHHAAAASYQSILNHFRPARVLGFTATPNRSDGVRLDNVFDKIIFQRDLRWGIENGWLARLRCLRVNIGYDLSAVHSKMGDYSLNELEHAVNIEGANRAVAEAYAKHATGQTLIFATTVSHAENIAELIHGAVALSANSKDRAEVLEAFARGDVPCLVNCMLFTEGTDLPGVRTVMMARPTQSVSLYTQMVGRGTRLAEGKSECLLIDCVGNSRHDLCTAPSLIGIDASQVPESYQLDIVGDLINDLPAIIERAMDTPESWIRNVEIVNLWAKKSKLNMRGINFFQHADGRLEVNPGSGKWIMISPADLRGQARVTTSGGWRLEPAPMQECIDQVYAMLTKHAADVKPLWSLDSFKRWGKAPASDKQKRLVSRFSVSIDVSSLTKGEANLILRRKFSHVGSYADGDRQAS